MGLHDLIYREKVHKGGFRRNLLCALYRTDVLGSARFIIRLREPQELREPQVRQLVRPPLCRRCRE